MSLLMDALKKAELAKRQGQGDSAGGIACRESAQSGLALEPLGNASPPLSGLEVAGTGGASPVEKCFLTCRRTWKNSMPSSLPRRSRPRPRA
jgi:hypothetical protein